jgi:hypothetical protein
VGTIQCPKHIPGGCNLLANQIFEETFKISVHWPVALFVNRFPDNAVVRRVRGALVFIPAKIHDPRDSCSKSGGPPIHDALVFWVNFREGGSVHPFAAVADSRAIIHTHPDSRLQRHSPRLKAEPGLWPSSCRNASLRMYGKAVITLSAAESHGLQFLGVGSR